MTEKPNALANAEMTQTRPEDVVPLGQKVAYSMGVVSDHYANVCLAWIFLTPFFVDFLGLGASIIGIAMASARLWDAFTDPLAGRLSDRCKSRFGRRKPFIFVGAILTGLMFPLIWMVPEDWSSIAITAYLFISLIIFYSTYSIFSVPYEALGAELTPDYRERSQIFVVRKYVQETFNLGIVWIFPLATWLAINYFDGSEISGVRAVSWVIALVIIGAGILPALFNVERYKEIAEKEKSPTFKEGVQAMMKNKPLLIIVGVIATYLFAIMATASMSYFVNVYYIYEGDIHKGATLGGIDGTLRFFFALGAAALIGKLTDKVDKHKIMIASVITLIVAFVGMYFTTLPGKPWLALVMKPLVSIGECGFWVLILSMRADVCDWDEYKNGSRNEGFVAAITNWCNKIAMTAAFAISGFLLQYVVGFDSQLSPETESAIILEAEKNYPLLTDEEKFIAEDKEPMTLSMYRDNLEKKAIMDKQAPGTMERLRFLYCVPQAVALLICLLLLRSYPLTGNKMKEIRAELERRRGKVVVS